MNPYLEEAKNIRKAIDTFAENQTDEILINNKLVFELWSAGIDTKAGKIYRFGDNIYRCNIPHTTQNDWSPDKTPALFTIIGGDLKEWEEGSYAKGTKRKHFGKKWISNVDNNIWEPGVIGVYTWDEIIN